MIYSYHNFSLEFIALYTPFYGGLQRLMALTASEGAGFVTLWWPSPSLRLCGPHLPKMQLFQQLMLLLAKAFSFILKLLMAGWALINVGARAFSTVGSSLQSCPCGAGLVSD